MTLHTLFQSFHTNKNFHRLLLFFAPWLIYGSSIGYDYALDDALYITDNSFTKKGFAGIADHLTHESMVGFFGVQKQLVAGGRYRPLAPITYSIEYALFGFNPGISHLINIILYGLLLVMLYETAIRFNSASNNPLILPFLAIILFMAHPLHVEVVANIKGRDQILGLMAGAGCILLLFQYFKSYKISLLWIGILFFIGLLAKESTITLLPFIPLAFMFFDNKKLKELAPVITVLLLSSVLWWWMRSHYLDGFTMAKNPSILNDPFVDASTEQHYATIFYTWLLYFKLLFFPYPLTHDYYPFHIALQNFKSIWVVISILLYAAAFVIGTIGLLKKKAYGFWIWFFAATFSISSNLFFTIGTFMNERFVFESSLAICFLLAFLFVKLKQERLQYFLSIALFLVYSFLSFNRSFAWKNNTTLFTTDVKTSANSVKVLTAAGGVILEAYNAGKNNSTRNDELWSQSIAYLTKAVDLLPTDKTANMLLANAWLAKQGPGENALRYYKKVLEIDPADANIFNNVRFVINSKEYDLTRRLDFGISFSENFTTSFDYNYDMGLLLGQQAGQIEKSIPFFEQALSIQPKNHDVLKNLGTAYGMLGNFEMSNRYFIPASEINPGDIDALRAIEANCMQLKQFNQAALFREKILKLSN